MKLSYMLRFSVFIVLFSFVSTLQAGLSWIYPQYTTKLPSLDTTYKAQLTPPPREYFSLNTLFLGKLLVHVGHDLINQNYVVMPSPNIQRMEKVGDRVRITIQQYFPELENKIFSTYNITPDKLNYLYLTGYSVYDQEGKLVDDIVLPEGVQYRLPQFYTLEVSDKVKILSFVFDFNGRTAWSDSGINTDLQGVYKSLTDLDVDRDSAIHLEVKPGNELKTFEVMTSNENQKLQSILSELQHIVVWGKIAQKEELIKHILDLKHFEEIDIDLEKGIEELRKYPQIFGDPLKWQSVINHISSERLNESEANSDLSVSAKLGLDNFFSFGGRGSSKRSSRLKEMVKFEVNGSIYIPKSLHFVVRSNESFDLVKTLVFQAFEKLEEANFRIGIGVSLDPQSVLRATSDRLLPGQQLNKGDYLVSNNGLYQLILQDDGNLVLYKKDRTDSLQWLWDSRSTAGKAVNCCIMQTDGNLVIYGYPNALWYTNTQHHEGAFLVLQDDGNLVIYQNNRAIWNIGPH